MSHASQEHHYVTKIAAMAHAGLLPTDVGLHMLDVAHDEWCGYFAGQHCDCDPDIALKWSHPASSRN